jgi:formiminotetrahydrofolate cyclodeaminase
MSELPLAKCEFTELLTKVASTAPSPGGGAVGALVVALGVACGSKAIRVSLKHKPDSTQLRLADDALQRLSAAALDLADADGNAFERLLAAYRLPKVSDDEVQLRRAEIASSAANAASIGQAITGLAQRAIEILEGIASDINVNIQSDYAAAHSLFSANHAIQQKNIAENLAIERKFSPPSQA